MYDYPKKLKVLINEISKFPGVGPKLAERISLYLLKKDMSDLEILKNAIDGIKTLKYCDICFNVSEDNICSICKDSLRDKNVLCIVETPEEIINIEKTKKYNGLYHVLHGVINPLHNILPQNLKIKELVDRVKHEKFNEIIIALNHTVEGDATTLYIVNLLKENNINIKITKLAKGLPTGADIKYADELTLSQAIEERKPIEK